MDFFGIGKALHNSMKTCFDDMSGTGRTTQLLDSLEDGDRVVCHSEEYADKLLKLAKQRGVTILTEALDPTALHIHDLGTSQKRTVLDHTVLEKYYRHRIEVAMREVRMFEREWSGYGEVHERTLRQAESLNGIHAPNQEKKRTGKISNRFTTTLALLTDD
jgi:hypothetical protein